MEPLADDRKSQSRGYGATVPLHEGRWNLEDLLAVVANNLSLGRLLIPVGHVVFQVGPDVDFSDQIAFDENGKRAIDGRSRYRTIDGSGLVEQFLCCEMTRLLEYGFEDSHTLASHSQIMLYQERSKTVSAFVNCHENESQFVLNSCQPPIWLGEPIEGRWT